MPILALPSFEVFGQKEWELLQDNVPEAPFSKMI